MKFKYWAMLTHVICFVFDYQLLASNLQEHGFGGNSQNDNWEKANQLRDKFEYDRERRMRERGMLCVLFR